MAARGRRGLTVQTFVCWPDDARTAQVLDRPRLQKQIVEAYQIARVLADPAARGWRNHPAVRMWRGHDARLRAYADAMHAEYQRRGYRPMPLFERWPACSPGTAADPPWWGGPIHASHRASLARRAPAHYAQFGWADDVPALIWPV